MEDDEVPPLLNTDGDAVAMASGIQRQPSLRLRGSSSSLNAQMYSSLRRSQTRKYSQSSMDDILPPRFQQAEAKPVEGDQPATADPKLLVFFALPVVAGIMFENGAAFTLDLVLVALAMLVLYWSVEVPWQWYHYARRLAIDEWAAYREADEVVIEESEEEESPKEEDEGKDDKRPNEEKTSRSSPRKREMDKTREWRTLQWYEMCALASRFISPAATSYVLHRIRQYLARPADSPVENASFLLFVLVAELPPLKQVVNLLFAHTLYLQRVVSSYDVLERDEVKALRTDLGKKDEEFAELTRRLEQLEAAPAKSPLPASEANPTQPGSSMEIQVALHTLQTQVNSLNRAMRQYEKRSITQQTVAEARFRALESRITDALTLAAATSRSSQRANPIWEFFISVSYFPIALVQALFTWPKQMLTEFYRFLFGPRRRKKKIKSKYEAEITRSRLEER